MTDTIRNETGPLRGPGATMDAAAFPFARPVVVEAVAAESLTAGTERADWPPQMSRLRALVEMLALIPAGVLGAVAAIGLFAALNVGDPRWRNVFDSLGTGLGALAGCAIMLSIGGQRATSIGWTGRAWLVNAALGAGALAALYAAVVIPISVTFPQVVDRSQVTHRAIEQTFPPMGTPWVLVIMTFVVLWEEVVFRGFLLTRLRILLGRWWLAILLISPVFGAIHFYEGFLASAMITVLAVLMGVLFVWRRSLVPSMVLHWLFNVGSFLILKAYSTTWQ